MLDRSLAIMVKIKLGVLLVVWAAPGRELGRSDCQAPLKPRIASSSVPNAQTLLEIKTMLPPGDPGLLKA